VSGIGLQFRVRVEVSGRVIVSCHSADTLINYLHPL